MTITDRSVKIAADHLRNLHDGFTADCIYCDVHGMGCSCGACDTENPEPVVAAIDRAAHEAQS